VTTDGDANQPVTGRAKHYRPTVGQPRRAAVRLVLLIA
jgi:hypothetical protein